MIESCNQQPATEDASTQGATTDSSATSASPSPTPPPPSAAILSAPSPTPPPPSAAILSAPSTTTPPPSAAVPSAPSPTPPPTTAATTSLPTTSPFAPSTAKLPPASTNQGGAGAHADRLMGERRSALDTLLGHALEAHPLEMLPPHILASRVQAGFRFRSPPLLSIGGGRRCPRHAAVHTASPLVSPHHSHQ